MPGCVVLSLSLLGVGCRVLSPAAVQAGAGGAAENRFIYVAAAVAAVAVVELLSSLQGEARLVGGWNGCLLVGSSGRPAALSLLRLVE